MRRPSEPDWWASGLLLLVAAFFIGGASALILVESSHPMSNAIEPETRWTKVDVLDVAATLVVQDASVHYLDVSSTAPPREVFRRFEDRKLQNNSEVAVDPEQRNVFVTDGRRIVGLDRAGTATTVANLGEMKSTRPIEDGTKINWHLAVASTGRFYFSVLDRKSRSAFFGEFDPTNGSLRSVDFVFPMGVAIDGARRSAYVPNRGDRRLLHGTFADESVRSTPTSTEYTNAKLSPNGTQLVLSGNSLEDGPSIATFDIATAKETLLPVSGSDAVWLGDETILFVVGENELWQHRIVDGHTERLAFVPRERRRGGSYAHHAVLSRSNRLLAWGFAAGPADETELRTIVVDLERREYRLLEGWWHNIAWLEPQ